MKQPLVCFIILNYNGKGVLRNCLKSLLLKTDYKNYKIVVVDNCSTDGSIQVVRKEFKKVKMVKNKENVGFVIGNNVGIDYVIKNFNPKYVFLLNNDTKIINSDWMTKLIKYAEHDKTIGIIGCKLTFPDGKTQWSGSEKTDNMPSLIMQTLTVGFNTGIGEGGGNFVGEVNSVSGACMMIRSDFLKRFGYLNEDLVPYFGEDVEICYRAWKHGYKVFYVGDVRVVHYQSYTFNKYKNELRRKKFYWSLRNAVKISKKYFGFWNVLIYGLPIFSFTIFLERNDKTRGIDLFNLKLRDNFVESFLIWLKTIKMIYES